MKLSRAGLKLVRVFLDDPTRRWSGSELSKVLKVGSGTLYPLLAKLETAKWLSAEWEQINASEVGRPRRRYYKLTSLGARSARNALSEFQLDSRSLVWNT